MKRIHIKNEFTQWAEYLTRYFGDKLAIYDLKGYLMWGSDEDYEYIDPKTFYRRPSLYPIYKDIAEPVAYYDMSGLTNSECMILKHIIPFIESQLDDNEEGA